VGDRSKAGGPLAGLAAAAEAAGEGLVAVAADMPFLDPQVLTRLWALSRGTPGAAPRVDGHWVPLVVALRPPAYLPLFELARSKPAPGPARLLDEIGARPVEPAELGLTPEAARRMFQDIDTPADLAALAAQT
jgi:molybdopterin-guanine dinucleotide biosynthesis protein A